MNKNEKISMIVDYLISEGTSDTTTGNYIISYLEISEILGIPYNWIKEHRKEIIDILDARDEILSETWGEKDDEFDMDFCLGYCPNYDEDFDLMEVY